MKTNILKMPGVDKYSLINAAVEKANKLNQNVTAEFCNDGIVERAVFKPSDAAKVVTGEFTLNKAIDRFKNIFFQL